MQDTKRYRKKENLILQYRIFEIDEIDNFIASQKYNIKRSKKKYYRMRKIIEKIKKIVKRQRQFIKKRRVIDKKRKISFRYFCC